MPVDIFGKTTGPSGGVVDTNSITIGQLNAEFLRRDGGNTALADIDFAGNKLLNVSVPTNDSDGVNKLYVDQFDIQFLKKDGTTPMTGNLNMDGRFVIGVSDPIIAQDASTKNYVDTNIAAVNSVLSGIIASTTVASVNLASSTVNPIPTALTPIVLVLDPNVINNPSDPTILDCVDGGIYFRIYQAGTYALGYNALFSNSTTTDITINAFLRDTVGTDILTINPILCTRRPNASAPNTTTSFIINNQFTIASIPPTPGYIELSILAQASAVGVSSLYRDGYMALTITQAGTSYLPLSGGQMLGDIDMNTNAITNLKNPAIAGDAVNKSYVDSSQVIKDIVYIKKSATASGSGNLLSTETEVSPNFGTYFTKLVGTDGDYEITNTNFRYIFTLDFTAPSSSTVTTLRFENATAPFSIYVAGSIPANSSPFSNEVIRYSMETGTFTFVISGSLAWNNLNDFNVIVEVVDKVTFGPVP